MKQTKVGIIGCGKQAPKHIAGFKNVPGVELVLTDIHQEVAEGLSIKENLPFIKNPDALFLDPTIDAVDICTPTCTHIKFIEKAIESGKDFFCEKPLCESLNQAKHVQRMLEKRDRIGMIGYIYRFIPVFEIAHQLFNNVPLDGSREEFGKVTSAYFRIGGRGGHQLWKHSKESGGGAFNEMMVHMIDLAVWFFGKIKEFEILSCDLIRPKRFIQDQKEFVDAEDYLIIKAIMENGATVLLQADLITPAFTQFIEVQGENWTFAGSIQADMPSYIFCENDFAAYPKGKTKLNSKMVNLYNLQMAEFVRAVRSHENPLRNSIHDSVILLEIQEQIKRRLYQK